jgi:hypothetical protein
MGSSTLTTPSSSFGAKPRPTQCTHSHSVCVHAPLTTDGVCTVVSRWDVLTTLALGYTAVATHGSDPMGPRTLTTHGTPPIESSPTVHAVRALPYCLLLCTLPTDGTCATLRTVQVVTPLEIAFFPSDSPGWTNMDAGEDTTARTVQHSNCAFAAHSSH